MIVVAPETEDVTENADQIRQLPNSSEKVSDEHWKRNVETLAVPEVNAEFDLSRSSSLAHQTQTLQARGGTANAWHYYLALRVRLRSIISALRPPRHGDVYIF